MRNGLIYFAIVCMFLPGAGVTDSGGHSAQPYAGMENREIKSLSAEDIAELQVGGGWGLALPAELNGLPGPRHLLDHREELDLTADQIALIETMFAEMQDEAIRAGNRFIAAEAALSAAFAKGDIGAEDLRALLSEASDAREKLRFVHLSRHLATPAVLTEQQIQKYAVVRGYASDPCANVPDGHDAEMWRKHNGCE